MNVLEALAKSLAQRAHQNQGPCTCIYCALYRANWIESIDVQMDEDEHTAHFTVEHSYPKGINIRKWVAGEIDARAPQGSAWTLKMKTIPHGSKRGKER